MANIDASKLKPGTLGKEVNSLLSQGENAILIKGVVEEIICVPEMFDFEPLLDRIEDPKTIVDTPANTALVRVITGKEYKNSGKLLVCHPLLPQHLQLPIKVGEHVFFFRYGNIGYWLARVPDVRTVEDVNYSHGDRRHMHAPSTESTIDQANSASGDSKKKTGIFNDGGGSEDQVNFSPDDSYEKILETSTTNNSITKEPVPFFLKRPGDLVLQGSNNTLICLGQNRGWTKKDEEFEITNAFYEEPIPESGAIDLVVGRGRYVPINPTTDSADGDDPIRTSARLMTNTVEGQLEADRMSALNEITVSPIEGDPDYEYDAARFNLSIKASYDENFFVTKNTEDEEILPTMPSWPDDGAPGSETEGRGDGAPLVAALEQSYSVLKSDQVRIIARRQEENVNGLREEIQEINGSIKIIKEGIRNSENGDGQAVIIMQPDGTIMIDGPTVIIGSGHADLEKENGMGTQVVLGRGATEPIVLGNMLKDLLDTHFNDIKGHLDNLKTHLSSGFDAHFHPTGVGPSGPPTVPSAAFAANIDTTKSAIDGSIDELVNTLSKYGKTK
jgi:hypothetical protein